MKKGIFDISTGTQIEVELTAEDLQQMEIDTLKAEEMAQVKADTEAARAALLDRLGITADEAKLLLS